MKSFEVKYHAVLDLARIIFSEFNYLIFCGGTSLNTFYLNYRYSEDIDIGYKKENPKTEIEQLLERKGCMVSRTNMKIRDIITINSTEIKMDVFEYTPFLGVGEAELSGVKIKIPTLEEFLFSKTISFLTREELAGLIRDAYDCYFLCKTYPQLFSLIKKHKEKIRKSTDSIQHNFGLFYENKDQVEYLVSYLLKEKVDYSEVEKFLKKMEVVLA